MTWKWRKKATLYLLLLNLYLLLSLNLHWLIHCVPLFSFFIDLYLLLIHLLISNKLTFGKKSKSSFRHSIEREREKRNYY